MIKKILVKQIKLIHLFFIPSAVTTSTALLVTLHFII